MHLQNVILTVIVLLYVFATLLHLLIVMEYGR